MAFLFSILYHCHLDIELYAVVCMPDECFSLFSHSFSPHQVMKNIHVAYIFI